jgi:nicotinamide riboside transporter PnuC
MNDTIYWLTAVIALLGVVLNIRKRVACFYLWSISNAILVYADLVHGLLPQAILMAVYFVLSLWGIWSWRRPGRERNSKLRR